MSSLSTTSSPRTSLETTKSFKSTSTKSLISSSDSSLPHRTKQPSKTRKMWESLKRRTSFPLQNSKQAAPVQIGGPKRVLTWQRPRSRKVGAISREMNNQYVN